MSQEAAVGALLAPYLIGLREGLEATLVVSILVAFLVKSGRRDQLRPVWTGVGAAFALSVALGAALTYTDGLLSFEQQELFEAVTSILAVGLVTWMIFWMRRFAQTIAKDLRGKLEQAIGLGTAAVVVMAFLAVAREGMETAVFFYAAAQGASSSLQPLIGLTLGLATAIGLGFFMYAGAIRVNLSVFFRWTGLLLILVAGGIFKYGVHDLQEAGVLPGLRSYAYDLSGSGYQGGTWYDTLLGGVFNFTATPTVLETIAWAAYVVPVLVLFLLPVRRPPLPQTAPPTPAGATTGS